MHSYLLHIVPKLLQGCHLWICSEAALTLKRKDNVSVWPEHWLSLALDGCTEVSDHCLWLYLTNPNSSTDCPQWQNWLFNLIGSSSKSNPLCWQVSKEKLTYCVSRYVKLWEFGYTHHLAKYGLSGNRGRVTSVRFDPLGARFGLSGTIPYPHIMITKPTIPS